MTRGKLDVTLDAVDGGGEVVYRVVSPFHQLVCEPRAVVRVRRYAGALLGQRAFAAYLAAELVQDARRLSPHLTTIVDRLTSLLTNLEGP